MSEVAWFKHEGSGRVFAATGEWAKLARKNPKVTEISDPRTPAEGKPGDPAASEAPPETTPTEVQENEGTSDTPQEETPFSFNDLPNTEQLREAGYTSLEDLKGVAYSRLEKLEGVSRSEAKAIVAAVENA